MISFHSLLHTESGTLEKETSKIVYYKPPITIHPTPLPSTESLYLSLLKQLFITLKDILQKNTSMQCNTSMHIYCFVFFFLLLGYN